MNAVAENFSELPLGFSFGLAERAGALRRFALLSPQERETWVAQARRVKTKAEMQQLLAALENGGPAQ